MVTFLQLFVISLSLAADAFSVSIVGGLKSQKTKLAHAFKVALFFGLFQSGMPVIGWIIGEVMQNLVSLFGYWIAFILLGGIGLKMIKEALSSDDEEEKKDIFKTKTLVMLSIATSIDALVVGITLPLLQIPFLVSISVIGIVTFILSFLGFLFGKQLGMFGKKVEILGGVVLILIGFKILIEHL